MKIIGFNLSKIDAGILNRKRPSKITSNINIEEIKEIKNNISKEQEKVISVDFNYSINYNPEVAKIGLKGKLLFLGNMDKIEEILNSWKGKKLSDENKKFFYNAILSRATLKALELEKDFNLPFHLPMPSVKASKKKE